MYRAFEPSDIFWKNIPYNNSDKIWRILLTYFVMLIILFISFVIYFIIGQLKSWVDDEISNDDSDNFGLLVLAVIVSLTNGCLNGMVGVILQFVIRILSTKEKNASYTAINLTMAFKLTFALFINTAVIPFFVNYETESWFTRSGLVMDVFYNTISLCFMQPIFAFFGLPFLIRKYTVWKEKRKGAKSLYTQRKMNKLYEGQTLSICFLYARTVVLVMLACSYATLIPFLPIMCLLGGLFQYWFFKYSMINYYKVPERMNGFIEVYMRGVLKLSLFLYAFGQYLTMRRLSNAINDSSLVVLWIVISLVVFPSSTLFNYITGKRKVVRDPEDTYEKCSPSFKPDYVEQNPVEFFGVI